MRRGKKRKREQINILIVLSTEETLPMDTTYNIQLSKSIIITTGSRFLLRDSPLLLSSYSFYTDFHNLRTLFGAKVYGDAIKTKLVCHLFKPNPLLREIKVVGINSPHLRLWTPMNSKIVILSGIDHKYYYLSTLHKFLFIILR